MSRWFNQVRHRLGYPYWSLSQWLKRQVKGAVKAIDLFETVLAFEAKRRGFDGVVCGRLELLDWAALNKPSFFTSRATGLVEEPAAA